MTTARRAIALSGALLLALACGWAGAEERPKVGLVLSGGGARGGAHLGVLKVLEELQVPVDVVVGTSAGAIVGAAYATGMPLAEIEREMASLDTATLFRDLVRRDLPLARKADDEINYIGPEIGVGSAGIALPKGAVAGVALEGVLRRLTARQHTNEFDRLPIRFRAVATDVTTAEMVVLDHGSLSHAVRASMAVPAVVNPVEIDGRLLVDGGIARNLPVDVARALGAQVVIAVNIGTPLRTRAEITSLLSVSDQMSRVLTNTNVQRSLQELTAQDVLITPQLSVETGDFERLAEAAQAGEAAARAMVQALGRLALAPADWSRHLAARGSPARATERATLAEVRVQGALRVQEDVIRAAMQSRAGAPFDAAVAEEDMKRIYGRGDLEHVGYVLSDEPGIGRVLTVQVSEKSWGPNYLRFGLGLSTDFAGDSFFTLSATHRRTWLNALGGEWRNDLQIGHADRLRTEWLQPLSSAQRWFVAGHWAGERTPFDIYDGELRIARYRRQSSEWGADVGLPLAEWGEARLGAVRGHVRLLNDTSPVAGSELLPRAATGGWVARLRIDTLDNLRFPRAGMQADARVYASRAALGADQDYTKFSLFARGAVGVGEASALSGAVQVAKELSGNALPDYELFSLGGFLQLSGYRTGQLLGRELRFGRLVYTYRLSRGGLLDGAFVGISAEVGRIGDTVSKSAGAQTLRGNAIYLAVDTPIGPLYFGYGRANSRNDALYLFIGQP